MNKYFIFGQVNKNKDKLIYDLAISHSAKTGIITKINNHKIIVHTNYELKHQLIKKTYNIQQKPELKSKVAEVAKLIGNHWKEMTSEEKNKYQNLALEEKQKYESEIQK